MHSRLGDDGGSLDADGARADLDDAPPREVDALVWPQASVVPVALKGVEAGGPPYRINLR